MTISIKDVEHVAKLARLQLTEAEKQLFAEQLGRIMGYFDELKEVDTTGVEPLNHALPLTNVLRQDKVVQPPGHAVMLANAPDKEGNYFRVPKIGE